MELKKFEAPTLAQALQVIKRELGPEAIILSTRNKRSGFGLLNSSSVEVTATVSPEALERKRRTEQSFGAQKAEALQSLPAKNQAKAYDILSGSRLTRQLSGSQKDNFASEILQRSTPTAAPRQSVAPQGPSTQRRYVDIRDDESPAEIAGLTARDRASTNIGNTENVGMRLDDFAAQLQDYRNAHAYNQNVAQRTPAPVQSPAPVAPRINTGAILPRLLAELVEAGVEEEMVRDVGEELKKIMVREQLQREDLIRLQLGRIVMSRIRCAKPLAERLRNPKTPRVITFVGPTGVGKTTTLAKIAAELVINHKRPVTLATTDTYKIAAVEQLQTYANILRIPLEVCPSMDALSNLSAQLGPEEIVLVDTAGFGPRDETKLDELKGILNSVRTEVHLCLASTTRDRDLMSALRRFQILEPSYLVMTKLDETNMYGNVFNLSAKTHLPLSYFTMGQRVPEDIEIATKERLADLLLDITGGN